MQKQHAIDPRRLRKAADAARELAQRPDIGFGLALGIAAGQYAMPRSRLQQFVNQCRKEAAARKRARKDEAEAALACAWWNK